MADAKEVKAVEQALVQRRQSGLGRTLQFSPFGQRLRKQASEAAAWALEKASLNLVGVDVECCLLPVLPQWLTVAAAPAVGVVDCSGE